jgi:aminoglycoside 3-N-acetyltransferase|uniref:AAC(3) family N-acetyltransferase n=1 Tax=Lachnospira sp. TaxID=2049031 RepID=UPI004024FBA3
MNSKIGNYNKQQLKDQLESMGLKGDETILIHSSMKAIGAVDGGADTVLDAWMEYFKDGLLLLPTHTWKTVNADNPVYNPYTTPSCVGLLTNMFMKRDGVIRSLHPTHSMSGYGKNAAEYLAGEEYNNTPCTPGGCYDRLKEVGGKVLLVGVGHERNTYIHSVEEVLNVPNRLSDMPMELVIELQEESNNSGKLPPYNRDEGWKKHTDNKLCRKVYVRKHYNAQQPHISEDFVKLNQIFLDSGVVRKVKFGDADSLLCDAKGMFNIVRQVIAPDPECIVTKDTLSMPEY